MSVKLLPKPQITDGSNVMHVRFSLDQLTGQGKEYFAKDGKILGRWEDGKLASPPPFVFKQSVKK